MAMRKRGFFFEFVTSFRSYLDFPRFFLISEREERLTGQSDEETKLAFWHDMEGLRCWSPWATIGAVLSTTPKVPGSCIQ